MGSSFAPHGAATEAHKHYKVKKKKDSHFPDLKCHK
jgi:hypothetical protein